MKIKYLTLVIVSMFLAVIGYGQSQLYFENFENTPNSFTLNDTIGGKSYGNNQWIVNNVYTGAIGHPSTINEDSTFGGSISYAPYGHYLHIYDSASGFANDNYNPKDSTFRFAHMTTGICTKSLTNINFNFYYLCKGSPSAYGVVLYSIDGGPWRLDSARLRYDSTYKWRYQTITNPAFSNVEDLRFGFLWRNKDTTGTDTTSFGIDDASIYGTYDSINHPIKCTFSTVGFDTCEGENAYMWISAVFSDSSCYSAWDLDVSNGNGPTIFAYTYYVGPTLGNDINDGFIYASIPNSYTTSGECFKLKFTRLTYPYLTFTDSVCFPLSKKCPVVINALQPPPTLDTNPVCAGSVIDMPFFSYGVFGVYNVYYAQLIDSIGNTAVIDTIGTLVNNVAFTYPPGDIVGTIPLKTPAGCHYYIRIVSSTPFSQATVWGPFCIQHCDIYSDSNVAQTLQACLEPCNKQPNGWTDTVVYDIHKFDSLAHYYPGNKFEIQLIQFNLVYPVSFAAINTGLLGAVVDTTSGKIYIHVPCPDTLAKYGIQPGVYYIRIIADSSSFTDSSLGTLMHLSIGEPADSMYLTLGTPGPFCAGATIDVYANPPNYNSTYTWWYTDKTNGHQQFLNATYPYLQFYDPYADTMVISCQENNYGCLGPVATLPDTIIILGKPVITKTGPIFICLSDTGTYSIPFANNTDYIWTIPAKTHADTSNNVLKIKFDSVGSFSISVYAFNACYSNSVTFPVHVIADPVPVISANPPSPFCEGTQVKLTASGATSYKWSTGKTRDTLTVLPTKDTLYWVGGSNQGCTIYDTINLTVIPSPKVGALPNPALVCPGDTATLKATGASSYVWEPNTDLINNTDSVVKALVTGSVTYTVTGTGTGGCKDTATVSVGLLSSSGTVSTAEAIHEGSSITSVELSAGGGSNYLWTPPSGLSCDTCPNTYASPSVTTTYTVQIKDANGCRVSDTVTVEVIASCNIYVPDAFAPGGKNTQNSVLKVHSECLQNMDFIIFDRWGNKVFESKDITEGWDGTYRGEPMNAATFVYYVTGTTTDGKTLSQKGNVSLIR